MKKLILGMTVLAVAAAGLQTARAGDREWAVAGKIMTGLFVASSFWHARLGLQVSLEDYVKSSGNKFALFALLNLLTFGGAGFALLSIVRIALGAA